MMSRKGGMESRNSTASDRPEMPAWLTESSRDESPVDLPIDPWIAGGTEDAVLAADVPQISVSEIDNKSVATPVPEVPPHEAPAPSARLYAAAPVRATVSDSESDAREDIVITDTTFVDEELAVNDFSLSEGGRNGVTSDDNESAEEQVSLGPSDDELADGAPFGSIEQVVVNEDTVLLCTGPSFRTYIWGAYQVRVLRGTVTIHGAVLTSARTEYVPVYALRVRAVPALAGSESAEDGAVPEAVVRDACPVGWEEVQAHLMAPETAHCVFLVRRLPSRLLSLLADKHGDLFAPVSAGVDDAFFAATGCRLLTEGAHMAKVGVSPHLSCPEREQALSELTTHAGPLRVALVGGKGLGKSTLVYRLLNALLSRHRHVFVLDCDPGQAEFTPCACLSLLKLRRPLLGPSFTHIQQPLRSIFIGEVSVANDPAGYLYALQQLSATYSGLARHDAAPLLVNTMGWVKDLGQDLLLEVLTHVQPTHVLELVHPHKQQYNFAARLTPQWVNTSARSWLLKRFLSAEAPRRPEFRYRHHSLTALLDPHHPYTSGGPPGDESQRLAPWMSRQLNTTAMVVALECPGRTLCQLVPVCVAWSALAVRVRAERLLPQHLLHAVNGCVVALCRSDPACWLSPPEPGLFSLLPDHTPPPDCLGFGLVRGVDWEQRLLYLLTALSEKQLRAVNTLVRGPHHLLDVFPSQSGVPVWAPALTSDAGPLNRPNQRNKTRRFR